MSLLEILDNLIRYKNDDDKMKWSPEDILTIEDVWLLLDYITNYKSRNEKAIEYIYTAIEQEYDEESEYGIWLTERINNLKNILQGSDKE